MVGISGAHENILIGIYFSGVGLGASAIMLDMRTGFQAFVAAAIQAARRLDLRFLLRIDQPSRYQGRFYVEACGVVGQQTAENALTLPFGSQRYFFDIALDGDCRFLAGVKRGDYRIAFLL